MAQEPLSPLVMPSVDGPTTAETESRAREISLITSFDAVPCHCWVSLYRHGTLAAGEVMKEPDLAQMFERIHQQGINERENLLLGDATVEPARMLFLLPFDPKVDLEDICAEMTKTLLSWAPERLGFYIPPHLMDEKEGDGYAFLRRVMETIIPLAKTREYFLFVGAQSTNALLNGTLKVKHNLQERAFEVRVFH